MKATKIQKELKYCEKHKIGFEKVQVRGSHVRFKHPDGRRTVIPIHGNEKLGKGLISEILKQIKLNRAEFEKLL